MVILCYYMLYLVDNRMWSYCVITCFTWWIIGCGITCFTWWIIGCGHTALLHVLPGG